MELEGLVVEDQHKDTFLYAGIAKVRITDWFFLRNNATLKFIGLQNTAVNMKRTDSVWNYQFLVDYFSGPNKDSTQKKGLQLALKEIDLDNIQINRLDQWAGKDTRFSVKKLYLNADEFDLIKKHISISKISLNEPEYAEYTYTGKIPKPTINATIQAVLSNASSQKDDPVWNIQIGQIDLNNARLDIGRETPDREPFTNQFDGDHLRFSAITGTLKDLRLIRDSLTSDISLTAREACGIKLKNLQARFTLTPRIMEFKKLLLETNQSRIGNYYAMHFTNFDPDFAAFVNKVILEANFDKSSVNSNDLAFFAPELKSWNRDFILTGNVIGTVDNLTAKRTSIRSGNTLFDGDFALRGLPDLKKTFIDLSSREFRTNYSDLVGLVPSLRYLTQPNLQKLGNIHFKGNFTGFYNDFVTFGNLGTNLGSLGLDINMKLPDHKTASYSGNISSSGFQLGQFMNTTVLGKIALVGKLKGSGFSLADLDAKFDGMVHEMDFNGYTYHGISINGNFQKKLFNGHLDIDDPNLLLRNLNGTIDLTKGATQFNFDALLEKANLKKLKLTNEDFALTGHFNFNFTGNNIDNFLGAAKVYDASLRHDSTKLSFDSLALVSFLENGNKVLTLNSNEIDGKLTGQFRILELPDAFKILLNRYYPSYIQPPSYKVSDQDFSFLINTRIVDDFVVLVDPKLKGFNNSTFSGSLKLAKNELNVNATIPQFEYDHKVFNDITLKSKGNSDTLQATLTAGDIVINDSLHFPGSVISIRSNNDISEVKIKTSAGKTLSSTELNATVKTLTEGVVIDFAKSSFILNDKNWQLEKNGKLSLLRSGIEASDIKFMQGDQEIVISSEKDAVTGKSNLVARMKKVNINDISNLLLPEPRLEGLFTGNLTIKDPFGSPTVQLEGDAAEFRFENKPVGLVKLKGDLNTGTGLVQFSARADSKENKFSIDGHYNYKDSTDNQLDIDFLSDHFNINLLDNYLGSIFSNLQGDALSTLKVKGGVHKTITGTVNVTGGSFLVNYTQCRYFFSNETILFNPDEIDIGNIILRDTLQNTGTATGKMYHNFFKDFSFDGVRFETPRMLVLNTTKKDNSDFYGKVVGNALMTLDGPVSNLKMNIDGSTSSIEKDSSHIYLPSGSSREVGKIDYIEFIQFGKKMDEGLNSQEGTNIVVNMNIAATPACKIDVILDEELGDVIRGRGNGLMNIRAGTKEPLTIRGRYDIIDGEYTFNFQTFLKKYFTIKRGSIVWNGDPYLAKINIDAEYLAKNVDVSSLASSKGFKQRENVTIISHLTGNLQKPDISFDFDLPPNSEIRDDYVTKKKLEDFKNDPNEMNKQVASLLLFNSFISGNQNFLSGGNTFSLAANTIGGIVSNMLTNLFNKELEKATKGVLTTYFDINSSLDLENNAALLQASLKAGLKILLSNRLVVLIGGNLDYNNPYAQLAKKGLLTPDISIEWLLNKDGSLRVVGFNRTSIDLTVGQRNRSGISLSYRKDFDRLSDLFRKKNRVNEPPKKVEYPKEEPVKVKLIPLKN